MVRWLLRVVLAAAAACCHSLVRSLTDRLRRSLVCIAAATAAGGVYSERQWCW